MVSCLLVVSHPDDDALFAGQLQSKLSGAAWTVVCVTFHREHQRAAELLAWQASLGTAPGDVFFLGHPDDPEDWRQRRSSIDRREVERGLARLSLAPDLVVTHNDRGEYGHPHHVLTHRAAVNVYRDPPILVFGMGLSHVDIALPCPDKPRILRDYFPSQRKAVARLARTREKLCWQRSPGHCAVPVHPELQTYLAGLG
jgi:LmbE family N-acetylglucosaminyl deacetylase